MELDTVAVAQVNTTVGDVSGNVDRMLEMAREAARNGADLIVFPELVIPGYPAQDLLLREDFVRACEEQLDRFESETPLDALVGTLKQSPKNSFKPIYNAAAYIRGNEVNSWFYKRLLPTYDVFDEARYFQPGPARKPAQVPGPVTICEDVWNDPASREVIPETPEYDHNPVEELLSGGSGEPGVMFNLSASPYEKGKESKRMEMLRALARSRGIPVVMSNLVGGNDSLIFDGHSAVVGADGELRARAKGFEEDLIFHDFSSDEYYRPGDLKEPLENVYRALTLGLRDYFHKCGFTRAVLGLSGGIDSSLTATLAADALGGENVLAVLMPSSISSVGSVEDSRELADNLDIETRLLPIQSIYDEFMNQLEEDFRGTTWDTAEENLQARIRGDLLMAFSNKQNRLLLSTGNKSELAVGYCTLYGDMNGGLAVLSDVPKTMVYDLARHRNRSRGEVIPESILTKPPSAELAPDQRDRDSLPEYEVLDEIIERYVERRQSIRTMVEAGLQEEVVRRTVRMIDRNEYKRQQAPPGLKVTSKSFGVGRVMPIAQGYEPEENK